MAEWRIRRGTGSAIGPFETQRVLRAIRAGKVPQDSLAQRVGNDAWTPITRILEFSHVFSDPVEPDRSSAAKPLSSEPLPWDEDDDEATRLMDARSDEGDLSSDVPLPPAPAALPGLAAEIAGPGGPRPALRVPKLPPKPTPPGGHGPNEGSSFDELRDAIEEDDTEIEQHLRRAISTTSDADFPPSQMAVALPPLRPGKRRSPGGSSSSAPSHELPSISVHPDHERTSPARRALRSTPEQLIRQLVLAVIILSIALGASLVLHIVR